MQNNKHASKEYQLMHFLKYLFIGMTLTMSLHCYATVGGGQHIEVLGYETKEQKLYLLRHFEDESGRLAQLYYYQLNSKSPDRLIEVKSSTFILKLTKLIMIKMVLDLKKTSRK